MTSTQQPDDGVLAAIRLARDPEATSEQLRDAIIELATMIGDQYARMGDLHMELHALRSRLLPSA